MYKWYEMSYYLFSKLKVKLNVQSTKYTDKFKDRFKYLVCYGLNTCNEHYSIVINEVKKIQNTGSLFLSNKYSYSKDYFYIHDYRDAILCIKTDILSDKIEIQMETDFNIYEYIEIIEDIIFCKLIQMNILPVHSSSIHFQNKGYVLAAWGGTGKTRVLLEAINSGCRTVSDDWTFINEDNIYPYNNKILLMYYDIIAYPKMGSKLDLLRSKMFKLASKSYNIVVMVLERLKIVLKLKYVDLGLIAGLKIKSFKLNKLYFLQNANVSEIKFVKGNIGNLIELNFKHEKKTLLDLLNYSKFTFVKQKDPQVTLMTKYLFLLYKYSAKHDNIILLPKESNLSHKKLLNLICNK